MPPRFQVVKSQGIYHGLPTYPEKPDYQDLTAIVTGANGKYPDTQLRWSLETKLIQSTGISGYHMVKALAEAPERWSKIYCLSRRPPPDYFFNGTKGHFNY